MQAFVIDIPDKTKKFWLNLRKKSKFLYFALRILLIPIVLLLWVFHLIGLNGLLHIGINPFDE